MGSSRDVRADIIYGSHSASTTGTVSAAHDDGTKSRTKIDEAIKGGYQFHKDDTEHLKQLADDPFDKLDARQTLLEGPRLDTHSAPEKSEQTSSPPSGQLPGGLKLHSQSLGAFVAIPCLLLIFSELCEIGYEYFVACTCSSRTEIPGRTIVVHLYCHKHGRFEVRVRLFRRHPIHIACNSVYASRCKDMFKL